MITLDVKFTAAVLCLVGVIFPWCVESQAQSNRDYEQRVTATLVSAMKFHRQSESHGNAGNQISQKKQFYVSMARNLKPPQEAAHLPFPVESNEPWVASAKTIASGLKVNMNYQVIKDKEDTVICVDEEIASHLHSHVRFIAWYRNQVSQIASHRDNPGTVELGNLIDAFLESVATGLPRIKVKMSGEMNIARDQQIDISDDDVWGILSTINRYFFYKSQIGAANQKHQADYLLVDAMTKTAVLYGVPPNSNALTKIDVELSLGKEGWKSAGFKALDSWNDVLNQHDASASSVANILIPAKPTKPKPKPKPAAPAQLQSPTGFPSDVEDVKEVGGQIFIKRGNKWQLWERKR